MKLIFLLIALTMLSGCSDHTHDEHGGHDDAHAEGDEHGDGGGHGGGIVITHFTDRTELFVEFPPLTVGEKSPFAAHFTRLSNYGPVAEGTVTVRLTGGNQPDETFSGKPTNTPGIFAPVAVPRHPGTRRLQFELTTPEFSTVHEVGEVTVHASHEAAEQAMPDEEEPAGLISFLKETQWKIDFQVEPAETRELFASVPATGTIRGTADGDAHLSASSAGRLVFPDNHAPRIGQHVEAGDILAYIVPHASGDQDVAGLRSELARAEAQYEQAVSERKRLEGLHAEGAMPIKRVQAARTEAKIAKAALEAAQTRLRTLSGSNGSGTSAGMAAHAPISGTIVGVSAGAGQHVDPGEPLLHIVQTDRLWLEARVSESDSLKLRNPPGAWFTAQELPQPVTIDQDNGQLIAAGRAVDPVTRTTPVIFEFDNPDNILQVGMHVNARVRTGKTVSGPTVPMTALVDEQGQNIVYVMVGGESFERRIVRTGVHDQGYVEIRSGIEPGERVVTEGAYLVRLAAAAPAAAGHGHAH